MSARLYTVGLMILLGLAAEKVQAHENEDEISRKGAQVCVNSNGAPARDKGPFPNRGNPNRFAREIGAAGPDFGCHADRDSNTVGGG